MQRGAYHNTITRALTPLSGRPKPLLYTRRLWDTIIASPYRFTYERRISSANPETGNKKRAQQELEALETDDTYLRMEWKPR